jgi:flagellar hook-associated protein 3 FlgL
MRVTDQMMVDSTLQNLWANETRMQTIENQLTSGKKLAQISDNPQDGAQALTVQSSIAQTGQFVRNVNAGQAWLGATDNALSGVDQAVLRAQELAVEGANDTLNASDRQGMANEVDGLIGQAVQMGNGTYAGSYLFNGAQTTSAPFSYNGTAITYSNTDPTSATTALNRLIAPDTTIQVNTIGHNPTTNTGVFDTVFNSLLALKQALTSNNTGQIQASITQLQNAQQQVVDEREAVGARTNQVTAMGTQLGNLQTRLAETKSNLEDADMVQATTDYAQASLVRQAGLAATAKALPPSLFNYLA